MAQTPNSTLVSLLTPAEFLKRADARVVAQLVSDTGDAVTVASLSANANLQAALDDAMGVFEAACYVGEKYDRDDLAALSGVGRAYMYRVLSVLAINCLVARRLDMDVQPHPLTQWSEDILENLRQGHRVLGLLEAQVAGHLDSELKTADEFEDRGSIVIDAQRYFGTRFNRRNGMWFDRSRW